MFLNWNSLENVCVCVCVTRLFRLQNNEHNFLVLSSNIAKFLEVVEIIFKKFYLRGYWGGSERPEIPLF